MADNRRRTHQRFRSEILKDANPDGTLAEDLKAKDRLLERELARFFRRKR